MSIAPAGALVRAAGPRGLLAKVVVALWILHALFAVVAVVQLTYYVSTLLAVPAEARTAVSGITILSTFFAIAVAGGFALFMGRLALFALRLGAVPSDGERGRLLRFALGAALFHLVPALLVYAVEMDGGNPASPLARCVAGECASRPILAMAVAEVAFAVIGVTWLAAQRRSPVKSR